MSRDEYNMLSAIGYSSPFGQTPSGPPTFGSDPLQDSFPAERTDDFETKARMSVLVISAVIFGLLGSGVFIYAETLRSDESSGEGVAVESLGIKEISGGPGTSAPTPHGQRTSAVTTLSSTPQPESSTTVIPKGYRIATDFINYALNRSFAPCEDFYNFVCGNFRYPWSAINKVIARTADGIRSTLTNMRSIPTHFQRASEKAAGLYRACVSLASDKSRYELEPVKALLSRLRLDISNIDHDPFFNIPHRMVYLSCVYGCPTFVKFGVHNSLSGKHLHAEIHKSDEDWMNDEHKKPRSQLLEFYRGFLQAYDKNINSTGLADSIFKLEVTMKNVTAIARASKSPGMIPLRNFGSYMKDYYDQDDWVRLISQATSGKYNAASNIKILGNPTPLLVLLLDKSRMTRSDARLLMSWSLIHHLLPLASGKMLATEAMRNYRLRTDHLTYYCFKKILGEMPLAAAHRWFTTVVPPSALDDAKRVGRNLKRTMVTKVYKTRWIRGGLWCMLNTKIKALPIHMGYPNAVSRESMLEELFQDVPDVHGNFTAPFLEMRRVQTLHDFRQNVDLSWNIATRNALYSATRELVAVYGGMLQPPVFIYGAPAAVNYGGLGQIIGHELMHAFDIGFITYNRRFERVHFEHTPAKKLYGGKVLCLRNSYYQAETERRGRRLNDAIDSEGFVDYAGLLVAYEAFKSLPEHESTATLPDVDLTADQIFFVSQCLKYCTGVKGSTRTGGSRYWHGRSRCIVPLRNMPEFAEAFKCKRGDRMNPEARCSFW